MVLAGLLEESLEVVYRWPPLALDTALGSCNVLLVGAVHFLVIVVIGCDYNPLRVLHSHLLVTLGILLGALDGMLDGAARLLPGIASLPLRTRRGPTASSLVPYWAAMSTSS
jgi:hypothetical protein